MNPERFLGSDPSPGDLAAIDEILRAVREVVVVLAETRQRIDHVVGPESIWQGSEVEPIVEGLSRLSARLRTIEGAAVAFASAWQHWRSGVASRQDAAAELVEEMSQLAGADGAGPRREDVHRRAREVAAQHERDAADLVGACEDLIAAVTVGRRDDEDLASSLGRGFDGLREAVDEWIREVSDEMRNTTGELVDVAEVTAVAPQLIGVGAVAGGITSDKAWQIAATAPASYRLKEALRRDWPDEERAPLPSASFETADRRSPGRTIADRIRGINRSEDS